MKQFPKAPQILIQQADGSVSYRPLSSDQNDQLLFAFWKPVEDFIDFCGSAGQRVSFGGSTLSQLLNQPA